MTSSVLIHSDQIAEGKKLKITFHSPDTLQRQPGSPCRYLDKERQYYIEDFICHGGLALVITEVDAGEVDSTPPLVTSAP